MPETLTIRQDLAQQLQQSMTQHVILEDDLLTVFCVLDALCSHDVRLVQGSRLAYALQRLVACEVEAGGPYASSAQVIDPAANAYIACFLRYHDVSLPQLEAYLDHLMAQSIATTTIVEVDDLRYFPASIASSANKQALSQKLQSHTEKLGHRLNGPQAAILMLALHELDSKVDLAAFEDIVVHDLASGQAAIWQGYDLWHTSVVVAALQLARDLQSETDLKRRQHRLQHQAHIIARNVQRQLAALPAPLRQSGAEVCEALYQADDKHEITLLPEFFMASLHNPPTTLQAQTRQLGVANLFCWMATIIYDDFIDEEGRPALLPLANVAYRLSLTTYRQLLRHDIALSQAVEEMYDTVDQANAWEVAHTRASVKGNSITLDGLPGYGKRLILAHRAFGHTIGPMLITRQLPGVRPAQIQSIQTVMEQYLIARQLNDDLHDWRKDLQVGQLSSILTDLLRGAGIGAGTYRLDSLTTQLEEYFFQKGLHQACTQILDHVTQCRVAMAESKLMIHAGGFVQLIDDLQALAEDALRIHAGEQAFLAAFERQ